MKGRKRDNFGRIVIRTGEGTSLPGENFPQLSPVRERERVLPVSECVVRNFRRIVVTVRGYFIEPNVHKFRVWHDEIEHII